MWIHVLRGDEPDAQSASGCTSGALPLRLFRSRFTALASCLSKEYVLPFVLVFPVLQTWVSVKQLDGLKKYQFGLHSGRWLSLARATSLNLFVLSVRGERLSGWPRGVLLNSVRLLSRRVVLGPKQKPTAAH